MKKILLSTLIASSLFLSSANAIGMTSGEYKIIDTAQWGIESGFWESISDLELTNTILSGQVGLNGNKTYQQLMNKTSEIGGAYGGEISNILGSCFDIDIPDFSKALGIEGLDFCGVGDINDIMKGVMKSKADSIESSNDVEVEPQSIRNLANNSNKSKNSTDVNCIQNIDSNCTEKIKKQADKEKTNGLDLNGKSTTLAVKFFATENYLTQNTSDEGKICFDNEWNNGSTESYSCRKDVIDDAGEYIKDKKDTLGGNSIYIDSNDEEIRANIIENNELVAKKSTDRINLSREIRNEHNIKSNPDTLVIRDVQNFNDNSFYKKNYDYLDQDRTFYIVPKVEDENFSLVIRDVKKYDEALASAMNLTITSSDGKQVSGEELKYLVNKGGGVTPFTSSYLGFETMKSVMAKNISNEDGEQGQVGRDVAMINGLKGVMYQLMMNTQQLDNVSRANYNIGVKKFNKISSDNDQLIYNLKQIQQQNATIINLLKKIADK